MHAQVWQEGHMKNNSSEVCRDIIDTSAVIQDQTTVSLIDNLVSTGKISLDDCKEVSLILKKSIRQQMDNLVDRVITSYDMSAPKKSATKKAVSRRSQSL